MRRCADRLQHAFGTGNLGCLEEEAGTGSGGGNSTTKIDATTIDRGRGVVGWGGNLLFIRLNSNAEAEETNFKRGV